MAKTGKPGYKHKEKVQFIPNYGLVYILDRGLQKQLDDLNEMKGMKPNTSEQGRKALES